jgi:hypothetical protein
VSAGCTARWMRRSRHRGCTLTSFSEDNGFEFAEPGRNVDQVGVLDRLFKQRPGGTDPGGCGLGVVTGNALEDVKRKACAGSRAIGQLLQALLAKLDHHTSTLLEHTLHRAPGAPKLCRNRGGGLSSKGKLNDPVGTIGVEWRRLSLQHTP